jgi:hypothetical protein
MLMKMNWDYLAGFVDGEGNISIYDRSRYRATRKDRPGYGYYSREGGVKVMIAQAWHVTFSVSQKKNEHVLEQIIAFLAEYDICAYFIRSKGQITGVQVAHRKQVYRLLTHLLPKLIVKKAQAEKAIQLLEGKYGKELL